MRLACVPAAHPYVAGLGLAAAGVSVLADPPVPGAPAGRWPPAMLDPGWIAAHAGAFDLMHLHFGFESLPLGRLRAVLEALRAADRPLVHTVHDLSHPQLADPAHHLAQLDLVVPAADEIITLTPGAAREIARRWGRPARVIAHPAMRRGPLPALDPVSDGALPIVGVHLRDLRPGIDGPVTVATLGDALGRLRAGGRTVAGRVWLRDMVRDPDDGAAVRRECAAHGIALVVAPRASDATLEAELGGLAVSLLPYRHGTHSGWVELCWDLGVPVALPAVGRFADQHPDPTFCRAFRPGDAAGLAVAIAALLDRPEARAGAPARQAAATERAGGRRRQRPALAAAHLAVYRAALARPRR